MTNADLKEIAGAKDVAWIVANNLLLLLQKGSRFLYLRTRFLVKDLVVYLVVSSAVVDYLAAWAADELEEVLFLTADFTSPG